MAIHSRDRVVVEAGVEAVGGEGEISCAKIGEGDNIE